MIIFVILRLIVTIIILVVVVLFLPIAVFLLIIVVVIIIIIVVVVVVVIIIVVVVIIINKRNRSETDLQNAAFLTPIPKHRVCFALCSLSCRYHYRHFQETVVCLVVYMRLARRNTLITRNM